MTTTVNLKRVGQIGITVRDLEKSVTFYRDVLGMTLIMQVPGMAFFDLGTVRLMLGTAEGETDTVHPASILYYHVEDIDGTHAALSTKGVAFVQAPHKITTEPAGELWMAFFRDVDDNLLALMSYK